MVDPLPATYASVIDSECEGIPRPSTKKSNASESDFNKNIQSAKRPPQQSLTIKSNFDGNRKSYNIQFGSERNKITLEPIEEGKHLTVRDSSSSPGMIRISTTSDLNIKPENTKTSMYISAGRYLLQFKDDTLTIVPSTRGKASSSKSSSGSSQYSGHTHDDIRLAMSGKYSDITNWLGKKAPSESSEEETVGRR